MAISQRITLEGGDEVRRAFEQLAAAINKLSPQFKQLTTDTQAFGNAGTQASKQVTAGLNETSAAAEKTGTSLRLAAVGFSVAAVGIALALSKIVSSLTAGAGETAQQITDLAGKLAITVPQMLRLRTAMNQAGVTAEEFAASTVPLARNLAKLSSETSGQQLFTFANGASVVVQTMTNMTPAAAAMTAQLQKMGVSLRAIQTGNIDLMMRQLAATIDKMPEGAAKAAAGVQFFGQNWRKAVEVLTGAKKAIDDSAGALGQMRIATREMSSDQVKAAKEAADQWEQFGNAIRAIKDQVGALFAGSSFARAKWLTDMVDDARILLQQFLKLDEAGRAGFLKNLGQTGAEVLFKTLVQTSELLASLWTNVLVPAGEALFNIFAKIAEALGGIPKSNVIAFFITAAIAAAGLTLALKGIALLLTPLSLLFAAVFSPLGSTLLVAAGAAVLFWDQLKAGAQSVAALIPVELADIGDSIKKLFAGDFSGFWEQFSNAAVSAFEKISAAAAGTQLGAALIKQMNQLKEEIPGAIALVVKAFLSILPVADQVAGVLNTVFGTDKFTGTGVLAIAVIGQMSGAFQLLASIVVIVGGSINVLIGGLGLLVAAFGGVPVAIGLAVVAIGAFIAALIVIPGFATATWNAVAGAIDVAITAVGNFISAMASIVWDSISSAGVAAWDAITNAINNTINTIKQYLGLKGGGSVGEAAPASGFAGGGLLGGRGTGTSDSNLAWVSRGEHIMPAAAVAQPGVLAFLEALRRSGGDLGRVLNGLGRFATGGLVGMPAFAAGGGVGGMSHVTIAFPGLAPIGGLRASGDVVEQLQRAAAMAQVRSGGRKPSRYT